MEEDCLRSTVSKGKTDFKAPQQHTLSKDVSQLSNTTEHILLLATSLVCQEQKSENLSCLLFFFFFANLKVSFV